MARRAVTADQSTLFVEVKSPADVVWHSRTDHFKKSVCTNLHKIAYDAMKNLQIAFIALLLGGCCPVGCDEEALIRPAGTITVTDAVGQPVAGARVTVLRFVKHPHFQPHETWQFKTDDEGRVVVSHEVGEVTQYPRMMHGVASFGWQVCVERGEARAHSFWITDYDFPPNTPIDQRKKDLELVLEPSEVSCEVVMESEMREPATTP